MTNIFVVKLNPDIRECTPYSEYPTQEEYREVHKDGVMNGFHEAVNFLSEKGIVRGYIPTKNTGEPNCRAMKNGDSFTIISITAAGRRREGENTIVGIQAGCTYHEKEEGGYLPRKNLANGKDFTWCYKCREDLSLLLPRSQLLANAREIVQEHEEWGDRVPVLKIENIETFHNIVAKVRKVLKEKEDIEKFERIVEFTIDSITQSEFDAQVAAALASDDLDNVIGNENPELVPVSSFQYKRDPRIVALALKQANGICQDCKENAPFLKRDTQQPYLEVHHKIPLAKGGSDTTDNVIALCPNCHRKRHFG